MWRGTLRVVIVHVVRCVATTGEKKVLILGYGEAEGTVQRVQQLHVEPQQVEGMLGKREGG